MSPEHRPPIELPRVADRGVSLKMLIPMAEAAYGGAGPRTSPVIYWLADAFETPSFWNKLQQHLIQSSETSHSVGGAFKRNNGKKHIGNYTWGFVHYSLDNFMKKFGSRATEFLIRDFVPENIYDPKLPNEMRAARTAALERFPRLRRLYWEDYRQVLEEPAFWEGMLGDLRRIEGTVSPSRFFPGRGKRDINARMGTELERRMARRFLSQTGDLSQRAQLPDYHTVSQIISDYAERSPKEFLLGYEPKREDPGFRALVTAAKAYIRERVVSDRRESQQIPRISEGELDVITSSPGFWKQLTADLEGYTQTGGTNNAYSFYVFLRRFNRFANALDTRLGDYAPLLTAFTDSASNSVDYFVEPGKKAADYLMWQVESTEETEESMLAAKRAAARLFSNDCMYVQLQLPEFWEDLQRNLASISHGMALSTFLRYFSPTNPTADRHIPQTGDATYQKLRHRSYHEPKDLEHVCKLLGLPVTADYLDNLRTLMYHLAPEDIRNLLSTVFYHDFNDTLRERREIDKQRLNEAKQVLLNMPPSKRRSITFDSPDEALAFRTKIQSSARNFKIPVATTLSGNTLRIRIKDRQVIKGQAARELEDNVERLRNLGWKNAAIAEKLHVPSYEIQFTAQKLIRAGRIKSRRRPTDQIPVARRRGKAYETRRIIPPLEKPEQLTGYERLLGNKEEEILFGLLEWNKAGSDYLHKNIDTLYPQVYAAYYKKGNNAEAQKRNVHLRSAATLTVDYLVERLARAIEYPTKRDRELNEWLAAIRSIPVYVTASNMRIIRVLKRVLSVAELMTPEREEEKAIIRAHGVVVTRIKQFSGPGDGETHEVTEKRAWNAEDNLPISGIVFRALE